MVKLKTSTQGIHKLAIETFNEDITRVLAENPNVFTGPGTNTYLIKGSKESIIIDPGPISESHFGNILKVAREFLGGGPISILLTHTHIDHSPLSEKVAESFNCKIYLLKKNIEKQKEVKFEDKNTLNLGDDLIEAIHTPGHASDHLCFLLKERRLIFSGDHVMAGVTPIIMPPDGNMSQYFMSLEKIKAEVDSKRVTTLYPGHGDPISNPKAAIEEIVSHRLKREKKVLEALVNLRTATLDELLPVAYDDTSKDLYPLAKFSLLAHLEKLESENKITRQDKSPGSKWILFGE